MPATLEVRAANEAQPAEKHYRPYGAALDLMRCTSREVLLAGAAGTGKSRACLEKLNLVCMQLPVRCAIVRKTRKSITQSAMVTMETKVLPQPNAVMFHTGDQEYRYPSGARIVVAGLDDAEKLASTEFDLVYVNEATELEADDWGMLLRGLRNGVLPYQQIMADCNPGPPDHWLKQRCDSGRTTLLESRHEDNPSLTPEYMTALDSLTGWQYQRLRMGLWVAAEGMYFEEWDPNIHIVPDREIPAEWPKWLCVDYGFAAPFCCLWLTREPETRQIYVYRELYASGIRDEQQAEAIVRATGDEQLQLRVLDPSMFNARTEMQRPSIAHVYAANGVWPVYPGMNSRKQGWAIMRRALASEKAPLGHVQVPPRLRVLEGRAPNLVRTLPSLVHDPLDPEDVADALNGTKTEDHAPDALRYGLCAEAQPPEATEVGDIRWS